MQPELFKLLAEKYLNKTATEDEKRLMEEYLHRLSGKDQANFSETELTEVTGRIYQSISEKIREIEATVIPLRGRSFKRIALAAAVLVLLVAGYWFLVEIPRSDRSDNTSKIAKPVPSDVPAPTTARATLKLNDGTIIYLDSAASGTLALQDNVNVVKASDGQISYANNEQPTISNISYNTITNPRGSRVQILTLSDGTKAWLNSESSIKYPVAFIGNERKVEITGEAYFEVAAAFYDGMKQKFLVEANGVITEVLGTHFNVNAYDDEPHVKVTLLEGSVRVSSEVGKPESPKSVVIKPGEQAIVTTHDSRLTTQSDINVEQVMAWKNGLFNFNRADLKTVMKQLARWYDMDVRYEGNVASRRFRGEITRDLNLSQVLKLLEDVEVKFRIEGKTLVVMR